MSSLIPDLLTPVSVNGTCVLMDESALLSQFPRGTGSGSLALTGAVQSGDKVYAQIVSGEFGTVQVSATAGGGDTLSTLAEKLANAISENATLQAAGIIGVATGANIAIDWAGEVGNDAVLSAWAWAADVAITVSGTPTNTEQVKATFTNATLPTGSQQVEYTVGGSDTNNSIATGLAAAINANAALHAAGITATPSGAAVDISYPGSIGAVTFAVTNSTHSTLTLSGTPTEVVTPTQVTSGTGPVIPTKDFRFSYNKSVLIFRKGVPANVSSQLLAALNSADAPIQ